MVPAAVTEGLRRKLLDVRKAQADAAGRLSDEELLARATAVGCVLLTQDADFLEIAARWQQHGIPFSGVLFAPQGTPIGRMSEDGRPFHDQRRPGLGSARSRGADGSRRRSRPGLEFDSRASGL